MDQTSGYDVSRILDSRKMGPVHWLVVILSFTLMLIDGYDLIAVAFVGPLLQKEWGFERAAFGALFSAATLGTAVGPPIFGILADKVGRKPVLILGTMWFALLTLACVLADGLQTMLILRFIGGIGIGGVIATAIAYVSEFAPSRMRSTMIVMSVVGLALGGGVGALLASQLLANHTWHIMFWVGGLIPLGLAVLTILFLPESPKYLALHIARRGELISLLRRMAPELTFTPDIPFVSREPGVKFSLAGVFSGHLVAIVPLLMVTTFLAQFALFFVNQWTTVLLTSAGVSVPHAAYATGAFQILGFLGALGVMRPIDRIGFLPVPILFAIAAVVIGVMGLPGLGENTLIVLAGAAGFCIIGLQFGNIATTGQIFPTSVRSGGVGMIYGVGRIGSFVGPALAGILVGMKVPLGDLFHYAGALMLAGVAAGGLLVPLYHRQLKLINGTKDEE